MLKLLIPYCLQLGFASTIKQYTYSLKTKLNVSKQTQKQNTKTFKVFGKRCILGFSR